MKFTANESSKIKIHDYKSMGERDRADAYAYMLLAEYELFKMHSANGVTEEEYGVHPRNLGRFLADIKGYYESKHIFATISEESGYYTGMVVTRKDPDKGLYVVSLYVDEDFRKNGTASALLKYVIGNTKEDKVTALIGTFNKASLGLFTKLGFKELGDTNIKSMKEYQLALGGK